MNVEQARAIRDKAIEDYEKLAELIYLPKVVNKIKEEAEKGLSETEAKIGGGYANPTPVPNKKVVDEIVRILNDKGFEVRLDNEDSPLMEAHAFQYGWIIKIKW